MVTSITLLAGILFLSTSAAIALGHVAYRPRIWRQSPTDVLILVAHQDDCVVLAGEYALWVLAAEKSVRVVYLTCGADAPGSSKAEMRNNEAIEVWRSAGVPESNLHFLGYRQSGMRGASQLTEAERIEATAEVARLIRDANAGTTVFLPAAGESHADHREIRRIGLKSLRETGRRDLVAVEAPEYNPYVSFVRAPVKALQYFLKALPIAWRVARHVPQSGFPGFVNGGPAYRLPAADDIHRRKNEMLRGFVSEDGELLVRHFGWRNQFRPVAMQDPSSDEVAGTGYIRVGDQWLGASVVAVWLSSYLLVACLSWEVAQAIGSALPRAAGMALIAAAACGGVIASFRKRKHVESSLLYASAALGTAIGFGAILMGRAT